MTSTGIAEGRRRGRQVDVPLLVALDIDGTLVGEDRAIPPATGHAVAEAGAAGHHLVLATGRSTVGLLPVARALDIFPGWAVASSGSVILRLDLGTRAGYVVEDAHTFDVEPLVRLARESAPDLMIAVEELGWGYRTSARLPDGSLNGPQRLVALEEVWSRPTTRVILRGPRATELAGAVRALGLTATRSGPDSVDVTPFGLSKATALEKVRERLGVARGNTVAVGDNYNDIDMLRWAARSVAMGHAPPDLLAVADEVTGTIHEHGVVDVLRSITPGAG
ncbi:HAD family hydrolase [Promicromonospora iranensis]|uniref:HAD family hydrolase n=1 Tax=Promicromonospora iranensis TaxID=1105144 RepID=UPI0023A98AB2|nr:HAD family hydrolase [Promicromonospora iranensis]